MVRGCVTDSDVFGQVDKQQGQCLLLGAGAVGIH